MGESRRPLDDRIGWARRGAVATRGATPPGEDFHGTGGGLLDLAALHWRSVADNVSQLSRARHRNPLDQPAACGPQTPMGAQQWANRHGRVAGQGVGNGRRFTPRPRNMPVEPPRARQASEAGDYRPGRRDVEPLLRSAQMVQVFGGKVDLNQADPASEHPAPGSEVVADGVALSLPRSGGVV